MLLINYETTKINNQKKQIMASFAGSKGGISDATKEQLKEIRRKKLTIEEVLKLGENITQWKGSVLERPIILGWPGVYGTDYDKFKRNEYSLLGKTEEFLLHLTLGEPYLKRCGREYAPLRSVKIDGSANLLALNKDSVIFNETFIPPERYLIAYDGNYSHVGIIDENLLSSPYGQIHSFVKDVFNKLQKT